MTPVRSSTTAELRPIDRPRLVNIVERAVDGERDFSLWGLLPKLYVRRWMLLVCILVPMLLSVGSTLLTPMTWVASTKILIRYSSSESVFLQNLIPDNRASLSGPVVGEILRSLPTLMETVRRYDIRAEDIYQEPGKVIFGKVAALLPQSSEPAAGPDGGGIDPNVARIAEMFQTSLEDSAQAGPSALGTKARPIEILGRDSTIPQAMKGDELITLTVRSFNRTKVAAMTNGLAQTLIDQYYQISAEDAHRSAMFLSSLVDKSEAEVRLLEQNPDAPVSLSSGGAQADGGGDAQARGGPAMAKLTNDLAALQGERIRAQQFFDGDSTRLQRTDAEIGEMKRLLAGQERVEAAKRVLEQIRNRRFQALNTENLYRSHLVPISVIDPAVTPGPSGASALTRLAVSALTGLFIGTMLGVVLVIIFSVIDKRLFTPTDVERSLGLPVFGWLPVLNGQPQKSGDLLETDRRVVKAAETGLLQILSHLDATAEGGSGSVVAITSANDDDGKSLVAMLIAKALARPGPGRSKVLLIDADPARASLTRHLGHAGANGLVDDAVSARTLEDLVVRSGVPGLDLLPAGSDKERQNMGFYLGRLRDLFSEAGNSYDLVIIDTPSLANNNEALLCCAAVNTVLVVVKSGVTRSFQVEGFLRKLKEMAIRPHQGVILNLRYTALPRFIDRGV